jgi:hypothetical protein
VADLVVGLSRFGDDEVLVSGLVDGQLKLWSGALGDWVVLPIGAATRFSVLAHDVEGERQAREIIRAFVGPGVATLTVPEEPVSEAEERRLAASGVHRIVGLNVQHGQNRAFLYALESLTATRCSSDRVTEERPTDPVNLLRDLRLALAQGDGRAAQDRLDALRGTGTLTGENMRFLQVELLARFERWPELVSLPYFSELERVRRPRRVSDLMLEAVWQIEVLRTGRPPAEAFRARELADRHRALLGSVDVPRQPGALALCYLSALADGDDTRLDRLLASSDADRDYLESLTWVSPSPEPLGDPVQEARRLLERHQFAAVVDLFLERRESELADLAVESVLELDDPHVADEVLTVVRSLPVASFRPSRRLSRDLAELEDRVSGACRSWTEWAERVAGDARWGEASAVARQNAADWPPLPLSETLVGQTADLLVNSVDGINGDQVAASLDLLCAVASRSVGELSQSAFLDAVLLILSTQENIGGPVRNAFNDLAWALLEAGPLRVGYEGLIGAATILWERIASPQSVDWALELLDALAGHSQISPESATRLAMAIQTRCTPFVARFSRRQALSMRSLLAQFGLPGWPDMPQLDNDERDVWATLDGASVGLYSLVAGAGAKLRAGLDELCRVRSLTQRTDTHASTGLQTLARNSDYMVVDTWHAAHAATGCIDDVRPRSQQILPRRGGTPALVAAIEGALNARSNGA